MRASPSDLLFRALFAALFVLGPPMRGMTRTTSAEAQTCTSCCESLCGDGVLDPGEECDDGDHVGGGCCGPTCKRTARCTLGAALMSPACVGQTIPAGVTAKFTKAETLIDQAATSPTKKAGKLLNKARNALKQARTKATRAAKGKQPRLSAGCAAALADAANHVAAGLHE